jgi:hypothetical protein
VHSTGDDWRDKIEVWLKHNNAFATILPHLGLEYGAQRDFGAEMLEKGWIKSSTVARRR